MATELHPAVPQPSAVASSDASAGSESVPDVGQTVQDGPRLGQPSTRLGRATEFWLELGLAGLILITVAALALR